MLELLVGGLALFAVIAVIGFALGLLSLLGALIALPFKLIGLALKTLIALPLLLVGGVIAAVVLGGGLVLALVAGIVALLVPLLPLALVVWGIWWLTRRKPAAA